GGRKGVKTPCPDRQHISRIKGEGGYASSGRFRLLPSSAASASVRCQKPTGPGPLAPPRRRRGPWRLPGAFPDTRPTDRAHRPGEAHMKAQGGPRARPRPWPALTGRFEPPVPLETDEQEEFDRLAEEVNRRGTLARTDPQAVADLAKLTCLLRR